MVVIAGVISVALLVGAGVMLRADNDSPNSSGQARKSPNIVVIMTDDQTVESMRVLPNVNTLIAAKGVTFANSIVSFPVCCPSRVTYLTGQYEHNHGVRGNLPPFGGYGAFKNQQTTFPVALQNAGYGTIYIGKYLNGYGTTSPIEVPPGWNRWYGSIDPSTYQYFGYSLLANGVEKTYGNDDSDYQTDVYTDLATSVIRDYEGSGEPFFLNISYLAPHVRGEIGDAPAADLEADEMRAAVPAPRHAGRYAGESLPESAAFDEADVSDKPGRVQSLPRITDEESAAIAHNYSAYLESLLAVDDGVERVMKTLRDTGQLDNTIVIFTSDNGFFFGEHRIVAGKGRFYEPSIRVPLLIRGPGVDAGVVRHSLVANIDLAPTILDLAGAKSLRLMDGRSLVSMLQEESTPEDRTILLEVGGRYRPDYGVRTPRYAYFEYYTGEYELYDLQTDPEEIDNRHGDPALASVEADLAGRLAELKNCAGETCDRGPER